MKFMSHILTLLTFVGLLCCHLTGVAFDFFNLTCAAADHSVTQCELSTC